MWGVPPLSNTVYHPREDFTGVNPQYLDLGMCVLGTGEWILPGDKGRGKKTFRVKAPQSFPEVT